MAASFDGMTSVNLFFEDAATNPLSVGGVSAAVSKTAAAPIERVKLLIQNQVRISHVIVHQKQSPNAICRMRC
jgi:hypothetical protein